MLLPQTYAAALLPTILALLCQGSWARTLKLGGGKRRFELFYFGFALGVMAMACSTISSAPESASGCTDSSQVCRSIWETCCWWRPSPWLAWR